MADQKKHGDKRRSTAEIPAVPASARWEDTEVGPKTVRMTTQSIDGLANR